MTLLTLRIEGGLLSPDFLETIHDQPGQRPVDFGLDARRSLVDEITAVWSDVRTYWEAFERRRARAKDGESLTSATREAWVIPLLEALGYRLAFQRRAAEADGRSYAISHRAAAAFPAQEVDGEGPPVHVVAFDQKLGERPPAGRGTMSPHALVQDYLNRSDDLWGIVTNGATLRLLRDSAYFSRPSYIEFDLQGMLDGERLDEFILFYRLAHRSRLAAAGDGGARCLLESYHQAVAEQGGRIRDGLRQAVEVAIESLANGFLGHPKNGQLRQAVANGELSPSGFYQQLLYLIYRLLFLMVAEERNLLVAAGPDIDSLHGNASGDYYRDHYSITRLRRLAEAPLSGPQRFDDLYLSLLTLFQVLRDETQAPILGLPALNGELFLIDRTSHLEVSYLNNRDLLSAIRQLSYFTPERERVQRRVNYAALDVEELGSVYESLLDEYPIIHPSPADGHGLPRFAFVRGSERKTTGSYYTPRELVKETLDSALDPVVADRLKAASETAHTGGVPREKLREAQVQALLAIRVCDPACGSGHFLLAAARRIGRALARVSTGEDEPSPEAARRWTREAIIHCIYGVDKNPLAVDLCKVALWIEGHAPGKPLTFLDAHIKCGDSLVGVFDLGVLDHGIPDDAFNPVTGDDKAVARGLKRRNKEERRGQLGLEYREQQAALEQAVRQWRTLLEGPEDTPARVRDKQAAYQKLQQQEDVQRTACDLWTAAFFTPLTAPNAAASVIPTTATLRQYRRQPTGVGPRLVAEARALAVRNRFFHWPVEFPHVFAAGGFDVTVGNPPWERIKLQEQEFFAARDLAIATAPNKAARQGLIDALSARNPSLAGDFEDAKHAAEASSKFARQSGRFRLTAVGDVNTYALFSELVRALLTLRGRAGIVVPTGIATDDTTKRFFGDLIETHSLVAFWGMDNEAMLFPHIDHRNRFGLLFLGGKQVQVDKPVLTFSCSRVEHLRNPQRQFTLTENDLLLLNPTSRTLPVFRTRSDAELTTSIYHRTAVLADEERICDPWSVRFGTAFHMANDSGLFHRAYDAGSLPLYEAKMMHQFDHRYATYEGATQANVNEGSLPQPSLVQKQDSLFAIRPRYWVSQKEVQTRLSRWRHHWLLAFRDITNNLVLRTAIFCALPFAAVGHTAPLVFLQGALGVPHMCGFLACLNALVMDYVTRQKVGGHLTYGILRQLPVLPPEAYTASVVAFIAPRVLELVYTAWDMAPFAADLWADSEEALRAKLEQQHEAWLAATGGHMWDPPDWAGGDTCPAPFAPAKWDEGRRAVLRAELDAYYARLYGLTHKQLRYILDPADLTPAELQDILDPWEEVPDPLDPQGYAARAAASDFPGETFRVLKEKEQRTLGEYRTRRLVLEAWDRLQAELGPVVVRNYRAEMREAQVSAQAKDMVQVPVAVRTRQTSLSSPTAARSRVGGQRGSARSARVASGEESRPKTGQPDLFGSAATPDEVAPIPERASPAPRPQKAAQPLLIPTPPSGTRTQRISRVMALRRQGTPEAIGELVAALGDEDEQVRWLAATSLQSTGGGAVIATVRAYMDRAPSAAARDEAEKLLRRLQDTAP